ncbi:MAG: hypothetical protein WCK51_06545 [Armatimonadota bacterium]
MPHPLEIEYGLTSQELLDAIDRRFRLKVALEGAVAEVHFERKLKIASQEGWLESFDEHDVDGMHDFTAVTLDSNRIRVEVKTLRKPKPLKSRVKLEVEIQKTRASKEDASSRYYDRDHFDVVAVCMGRYTKDWSQFRYILVRDIPDHSSHAGKLRVMNEVELDPVQGSVWYTKFQDVVDALHN